MSRPASLGSAQCAMCHGASKEQAANPETFDIHDHVVKCRERMRLWRENEAALDAQYLLEKSK